MKKDRNSFFEGSSMNMAAFNNGMPNMPMMGPMNASASASQSFYANMPTPMAPMMGPMMGQTTMPESSISELESRMAKLERNMNRLENRISKLEGNTYYTTSTDSYESSSSSGMYMV
jgi:hypothetical protein